MYRVAHEIRPILNRHNFVSLWLNFIILFSPDSLDSTIYDDTKFALKRIKLRVWWMFEWKRNFCDELQRIVASYLDNESN